jgi:hypothetical protein
MQEVPVRGFNRVKMVPSRGSRTVTRPRGMTDYQAAQVKIAENRDRIAKEESYRERVTEAIQYNLNPQQTDEYIRKSYSEFSEGTKGKIRAKVKADIASKAMLDELALTLTLTKEDRAARKAARDDKKATVSMEDTEFDNMMDRIEEERHLLKLYSDLDKQKASGQEVNLDGVMLAGYMGIGDGKPLDPTQTRLTQAEVDATMKGFAEINWDDISPSVMWSGVGAPMARLNQVPVRISKGASGVFSIDKPHAVGPMEPDKVFGYMKIAEDPNETEDRRKLAESKLRDLNLISGLGKKTGKMEPVTDGPFSIVSPKVISAYKERVKLEGKYGFGDFYDPGAGGVVERRRQEVGSMAPNPQGNAAIKQKVLELLQQTMQ